VLAGTGLFVRLVLWPALKSLMRTDLKPEIDEIAVNTRAVRELTAQQAATAREVEALRGVPVTLERIETNVENIMKIIDRRGMARAD
jgi:hypothetical protein